MNYRILDWEPCLHKIHPGTQSYLVSISDNLELSTSSLSAVSCLETLRPGDKLGLSGVMVSGSRVCTGRYPSLELELFFFLLDISLFLRRRVKSLTSSPDVVWRKEDN